jgi:hypothetical protein
VRGTVDIRVARHGDIRDRRVIVRVDGGQGPATRGIDELAANEQLVPDRRLQASHLLRALQSSDGTVH